MVVTPGSRVVAIAVKGRSAPKGSMLPELAARGSQAETNGMGMAFGRLTTLLSRPRPLAAVVAAFAHGSLDAVHARLRILLL
jgi:hypothetical protein